MNSIPPAALLDAWSRFDAFPMETLTKAWFLERWPHARQRTVEEMEKHRASTGASGNCFDLAIWLLARLQEKGLDSHAVGENLGTIDAHVGVLAHAPDGQRYLCDLGDMWIRPYPIDLASGRQRGYFAGAEVESEIRGATLFVTYHRSNGKSSRQNYELARVTERDLWDAAHVSQNHLSDPLVEIRVRLEGETAHWEYEAQKSFVSKWGALEAESPLAGVAAWSKRIAVRTGMQEAYVCECFEAHAKLSRA